MPALAHETIMGRPNDARKQQQTTRWYVNAYLHADDPEFCHSARTCLTGYSSAASGTTTLKYTQVVDLETLDYSHLEDGKAFILELVIPFIP